MELPLLNGVIDRRILINYRANPEVVKALLPAHIHPLIINGYASAGICLLRLKNIGVKYSPSLFRINSENAAHRFLVKWNHDGKEIHGVYIPRRDTDSKLNVWIASRLFSWPHYSACFDVEEANAQYLVRMESNDKHSILLVETELTDSFPKDSMFNSIEHASKTFRDCPLGVSPSTMPKKFKTIHLKTDCWEVKPLAVNKLKSSYFEDRSIFSEGSIAFDNALLMQNIAHEWRSYSNDSARERHGSKKSLV